MQLSQGWEIQALLLQQLHQFLEGVAVWRSDPGRQQQGLEGFFGGLTRQVAGLGMEPLAGR